MKGYCAKCRQEQARGLQEYCCVLCVLEQSEVPVTLTATPDGTTLIDLSGTSTRNEPK